MAKKKIVYVEPAEGKNDPAAKNTADGNNEEG